MWINPVLTTALLGGLVVYGPLAAPASAQVIVGKSYPCLSPSFYSGYNPSSVTPFGSGYYAGTSLNVVPYYSPYFPWATPNIPDNNQVMPIYSGSFSYFGIPNGQSLTPVYTYLGYNSGYVPPAFAFGGYNPSSVTPFK